MVLESHQQAIISYKSFFFLAPIPLFSLFHVQRFRQDGDRVHHLVVGRHLDLPLAGLAIGGHDIRISRLDGSEERFANLLRRLVVLALKAVCPCDAAAVRGQYAQLYAGNHLQ